MEYKNNGTYGTLMDYFFKIVKNANYDGKHHQMIENPNN